MKAIELLPLISPALGPKYSPNLHAWVRKISKRHHSLPLAVTQPQALGIRYVGLLHEDGWLSGSRLMAVLCSGAKEDTCALHPMQIDDTFWDRYILDGCCAIDPDHSMGFVSGDTRWKVAGDVRECQWCGHHVQVNLRWREVVNKSEWVPA
jgi:hypothetical protein